MGAEDGPRAGGLARAGCSPSRATGRVKRENEGEVEIIT